MKNLIVLLTTIMFLMGCSAKPKTYNGNDVTSLLFDLADGKKIKLPISDAGPIPAENNLYKIEVTGASVLKSEPNVMYHKLVWIFGFSNKTNLELDSVKIEKVFPEKTIVLMVEDKSPKTIDGMWSGSSKHTFINISSTPWLYSIESSVFVYKISIKAKGKPKSILYQPFYISAAMKSMLDKFK